MFVVVVSSTATTLMLTILVVVVAVVIATTSCFSDFSDRTVLVAVNAITVFSQTDVLKHARLLLPRQVHAVRLEHLRG